MAYHAIIYIHTK